MVDTLLCGKLGNISTQAVIISLKKKKYGEKRLGHKPIIQQDYPFTYLLND